MQPSGALRIVRKLEFLFRGRKNPWRCRGEYCSTKITFPILWKCQGFSGKLKRPFNYQAFPVCQSYLANARRERALREQPGSLGSWLRNNGDLPSQYFSGKICLLGNFQSNLLTLFSESSATPHIKGEI